MSHPSDPTSPVPTLAPGQVPIGRRVEMLSDQHPDAPALIVVASDGATRTLCWRELDRASTQTAHLFAAAAPRGPRTVAICLPNGADHVIATIAAWKLGACVLPLSHRLTPHEIQQMCALAGDVLLIADDPPSGPGVTPLPAAILRDAERGPTERLAVRVAHPGKAIASGGSTGSPKLIVDQTLWAAAPGEIIESFGRHVGMRVGQRQLVPGPLYHNAPFNYLYGGLFEDHTIVLMERFDATRALELIERHAIEWCGLVPTMMKRMAVSAAFARQRLDSLDAVYHTAAPCPAWVKQAWIDRIGAAKVYEQYGSTEDLGFAIIRGDEWLVRRGSVGRPFNTHVRIVGPDRQPLAAGEIGEIFMKRTDTDVLAFRYAGASPPPTLGDGYYSVGDLGWLDDAGYLYLADRRTDLIISGGANVYPAEVEAVLGQLPAVRDVAVIGLPDEDWGRRVHAVIELEADAVPPSTHSIEQHCALHLAPYKRPKSYEFVAALPRNEAGKLRRSQLVADRAAVPADPSPAR
jgi:bile acid-coenzyme A ligase